MPLPAPRGQEEKDDFISRCMSELSDSDEFNSQDQRLAVCYTQWREAKESAMKPIIISEEVQIPGTSIVLEAGDQIQLVEGPVTTVIVRGGKSLKYPSYEIREMLDDFEMYRQADNILKWIFAQAYVFGNPVDFDLPVTSSERKQWAAIYELLQKVINFPGSVTINVRSDQPEENGIFWYK